MEHYVRQYDNAAAEKRRSLAYASLDRLLAALAASAPTNPRPEREDRQCRA